MDRKPLSIVFRIIITWVCVPIVFYGCSPKTNPPSVSQPAAQQFNLNDMHLPVPGDSFSIQFSGQINPNQFFGSVVELDLFETDAEEVKALQDQGKLVMCYISAGSWENWRPDADQYPQALLGQPYTDWPGERWLDIRQIDQLAPLITVRLDVCAQKGFDGVEMDNVDGYQNKTGFDLQAKDQLTFNRWLAQEAHLRGLSIGLKNDPDQIPELVNHFDWALSEECFAQNWCELYQPFLEQEKAVFALEYTQKNSDIQPFCQKAHDLGIFLVFKHRELDSFEQTCPQ